MNASRPALPEATLATWSRTARPVRLRSSTPRPSNIRARVSEVDDADQMDDLLFGCTAAALMALPLMLGALVFVG